MRYWFTPGKLILISYIGIILCGSFLLNLPIASTHAKCSFIDSLFTATSAVCVTGLIVKNTPSDFSLFGQIIILLLIQIGGLGYMSFAALLFSVLKKRLSIRQKTVAEESISYSSGEVQKFMIKIIQITLLFEVAGTLILTLVFYKNGIQNSLFMGLFHGISAFCNSGFSLFPNSLCNFINSTTVVLTVAILAISGGLGFIVWDDIYKFVKKRDPLNLHSKIVISYTIILIAGGMLLILALEWGNILANLPLKTKLLASFFHSVTPRTAGFNILPVKNFLPATLLVVLLFMFIGASPGGTGGGIKTTSFAIILGSLNAFFRKKRDVVKFGRRIGRSSIDKAHAIVFLAISLIFVNLAILSFSQYGMDFLPLFFETVSAFGTVGLSFGSALNPACSLSYDFTNIGKFIIVLTMLIGKVGPLVIGTLIILLPEKDVIKFPKGDVLIG